MYKNFTQSTLGCLITAAVKSKSLVESVISNAFLFVPGLNVIAIIWRIAKLSLYMFQAIKFLAQGKKETRIVQKYDLYGKSFGSFM